MAIAKLKAFKSALAKLREDTTETSTELSRLIAAATCEGEVMFRKIKLTGVSLATQQAFKNNWPLLVEMLACVANRFDDLQTMDAMKGVHLLNFALCMADWHSCFCDLEVSLLVSHFKQLLEKNEVSLSAVPTEWSAFKYHVAQTLQGNPNIWPLLLTHYTAISSQILYTWLNSSVVSNQLAMLQ